MDVNESSTIRDAFERWYSEDWEWRIAVRRDSRGEYIYSGAATAWKVWKAAVEYTKGVPRPEEA